jgi:hypothetical protein
MPKQRGKMAHFEGRPTKLFCRSAMLCGLPTLEKFQSGPYASKKCVVTPDYAVLVGKSW